MTNENVETMDSFTAVQIAEGVYEETDPFRVIEAWAVLIREGLAWTLQGHFGRTAQSLIDRGFIDRAGEVNWDRVQDAMGEADF